MMSIGREILCLPLRSLQSDKNALTGLKEAARKNELLAHYVKITSVERTEKPIQLTRLIFGTQRFEL